MEFQLLNTCDNLRGCCAVCFSTKILLMDFLFLFCSYHLPALTFWSLMDILALNIHISYFNYFFIIQKGVGDKAVSQLEKSVNSKLEVTVARQIQAQFQTSGKQALQVNINIRWLFEFLKKITSTC